MYCMRCGAFVEDVSGNASDAPHAEAICNRCRLHFGRITQYSIPPHDSQVFSRRMPLHCRREDAGLQCSACSNPCVVITYSRGVLRAMIAYCPSCGLAAIDSQDREPLKAIASSANEKMDVDEANVPSAIAAQLDAIARAFVLSDGPET